MINLKQQTDSQKKYLNSDKKYQKVSFLLLLVLIIPVILNFKNNINSSPYISSLYWGAIIVVISFFVPSIHTGKFQTQDTVKHFAITGATIFIATLFIAGVISKSLKATPYDISPLGIFLNILNIFPMLIARELIRQYLIGTSQKTLKYHNFAIILITFVMSLTQINFSKIAQITDLESFIIYFVSDVGIIIARNIIMSTLVFFGDFSSSVIYMGLIELFQKCFPFLPELTWLINGAISISFPIIYSMIIAEKLKMNIENRREADSKNNIIYLISLSLSVLFSWFCAGVFSIYPSIILTGSMEPLIHPGDVILVKKMLKEEDINNLVKGDIINFQRKEINITHRIEEIKKDEAGNLSFVTKGDNNKSIDDVIVSPNDIRGIIINKVPKVGLPILLIKSGNIPDGVVDQ